MSKRIILTGGGTAGHITPNLALAPLLQKNGFDVHYIGLRSGMEEKLVKDQGIPFYGIKGGKLRRYFDVKNLTDVFKIGAGFFEAVSVIRKIRPDVLFSKGGFVSTPVVWAGYACRVPVVTHESDMTIGLANKLCVPFATRVCYTFPETGKYLPPEKGELTGLPIRPALLSGQKGAGLAKCGFSGKKPVLLVVGGSQGSAFINEMLRGCLDSLTKRYDICHICGAGNVKPELERPCYRQFGYVSGALADLFASCDVVVSRGGATSLFELLALKKPALIIPYSRKASRGDQIINAKSFLSHGFSEMLEEEDATEEKFIKLIESIYLNRDFYINKMAGSGYDNGLEKVFGVICKTVGRA